VFVGAGGEDGVAGFEREECDGVVVVEVEEAEGGVAVAEDVYVRGFIGVVGDEAEGGKGAGGGGVASVF
jgi:hypothetical protein